MLLTYNKAAELALALLRVSNIALKFKSQE
jgi:hypothetical protein